jgi:TolB-like protein/tetratricopeptide (TPR) repeat protein
VSLFNELKRRNVIRVALFYIVAAWLLVQVAETVLPLFDVPDGVLRGLVILLVLGFVPALVLAWVFELTPQGLKRETDPALSDAMREQGARRLNIAVIVLLLLAIGLFGYERLRGVPAPPALPAAPPPVAQVPGDIAPAPAPAAATAAEPQSIAVLAFADLSPDRDQEYFGDGIAEEILNALVRIPGLRVAGRTSSFHFKGRNEDLRTIGATLGVAHILEGSVRKQGERLRITAQLVRSEDGFHLWSETYDGTDADVFALQERIAREVTRELKVALGTGEDQRLVNAGTANPEAYALYLRATEIFNRREAERYDEGIAAVQQALRLDPGYARAHSRLATLYYLWSNVAAPDRYDALITEATRQAQSALELDPLLAEPHAVLAIILWAERRYADSVDAIQRASAIDPNDATTLFWSALRHCQVGAIELCERGLDHVLMLDPLLPNALGWRARLYISAGDLATAEQMIERAREAGLRWAGIGSGWIALERGDRAGAQAQMEEIHRIFGAGLTPEAAMTFAAARAGDAQAQERSRALIDDYLATSPARINPLVPLTLISMGDIERGLEVFAARPTPNEALFLGEVMGTRWYPHAWASPAFPAFLRKTGIAEYWDRFGAPERCRKDGDGDYRCE